MKNSGLFFWFFFALRAWAWNFKKVQRALAFCLFSRKSHAKAFCLVKFKAKCAKCVLALSNAPQKRLLNTNLAQFMAKIHSFLFKVHFGREFCLVKFGAKRPFITNYSVNFNANSTQIFTNSGTFLLNFADNFTNSHFKAYR